MSESKLRWDRTWKFRKHDFEIVVCSRVPFSGPTFWSGLEAPYYRLKGAGGVFDLAKVEIEFSGVSDRRECQMLFTGSKNIIPSQSY